MKNRTPLSVSDMARAGIVLLSAILFVLMGCSSPGSSSSNPSFTYEGIVMSFDVGEDAKSKDPKWTNKPGATIVYSISKPEGAEIDGVSIDETTGVVTVPKTAPVAEETWTVTAAVDGNEYTAGIAITVSEQEFSIKSLSYTPARIELNKGIPITHRIAPDVDPPLPERAATQYTIQPELSSGLSIDQSTGVISGTPDEEAEEKEYTVTLALSGGYSGGAETQLTIVVDAKSAWVETLVYTEADVNVKDGKVSGGDVNIAAPSLTQKSGLTPPPGTANYAVDDARITIDETDGSIVIKNGTDLSGEDSDTLTFTVTVSEDSDTYADYSVDVGVKLNRVKAITFDPAPTPTYGDTGVSVRATANAVNNADTAL
ncbi:MAG: putative Ig domain-containing protein, partial [Candidatus Thiodiazotropha taylori]|nr:putative Ig domain-containing protein [Candidatus Thiodiazotropha taylori]MCW4307627.1 putative Ig domain-containing protein [Candidatus Thiodiazotropha endolucinida]